MACAWCAPSAAARRPRPRRSARRLPRTAGRGRGRHPPRTAARRPARVMAAPSAAMPPLAVLTRPLGAQRGPGRACGRRAGKPACCPRWRSFRWIAWRAAHAGRLRHGCLRQRQRGAPVPGPADPRARRLFLAPGRDRRHCRPGQRARPARTARLCANTTVLHPPADAPSHDSKPCGPCCKACPRCPRAPCWCAARRRDWLGDTPAAHGVRVARHAAYDRQPAVWEAQSLAPLKRRAEAGLPATWLITSGEAPTPRSPICGPPACKPGGKAAVSC